MVPFGKKMEEKMDQKVVLLTGASGGMGYELAKELAAKGYILALHGHTGQIAIPENDKLAHFYGELSDESSCEQLVQNLMKRFGRIDVLINNAGISRSSMSWKTSMESWRETMTINLDVPFYIAKHVIPLMRERSWGRIINISSVVGQTGAIGTAAYAASKAGLIGLSKTLAKETAPFNITVNALALGYYNVGMIRDVPEEMQKEIIRQIPLKRLGDPATVSKTIELLISEEGGYITGQVLNLNGGLHG